VTRDTFEGALSKLSFYRVGTFAAGYTLTNMRQTLEYSGHEYSWAGTFPKVVAEGATLATSGGIGDGAWVDRTDVTLRGDLATSTGAGLVGTADGITVQVKLNAIDAGLGTMSKDKIRTLEYWSSRMNSGATVKIVCYGDSTTAGYNTTGYSANPTTPVIGFDWTDAPVGLTDQNARAPNAWPIKLQGILRAYHSNNNITVYNAGYSGQRLDNGWANYYYDTCVTNNPEIGVPDVVLIGFGLNDTTDAGSSVSAHISETIALCEKIIAQGATPILVTCDANYRSYAGWSPSTSGRDNQEVAEQIDAAKKHISKTYGISIIDQSQMQRDWMSKNSDYSNQYQLQNDGLHWGDSGNSMKSGYFARAFIQDIVVCNGAGIERVSWMDSRAKYQKSYTSSWVPSTGDEGFKYSRFPKIWYLQTSDYSARDVIFDMWLWCEGEQSSLIYRNFSNSNIGSSIAKADLPYFSVCSNDAVESPYFTAEMPLTGEDSAYISATDRACFLCKLRYGLNRVRLYAPNDNTLQFWGGWFEINPFWKSKADNDSWINNYGAPNYVQVDALKNIGAVNIKWEADPVNNRVAFMFPEMEDGSNTADIGLVGDKVDILVDGYFDSDTGFLFFGGKSLNRNSDATDDYSEDNCLLLYTTSTSFNLLHLRYPYQITEPYPTIATGNAVYDSSGARKFLIRIQRTDVTTQTVTIYDGWDNTNTIVLSYNGSWSKGAFCGAGIVGGLYATINVSRTARVNSLLIRKYR
jgi:lysophospholipase L1-like esterase